MIYYDDLQELSEKDIHYLMSKGNRNREKQMQKEKIEKRFYSTRSAIEHPAMCNKTIEEAVEKAQNKLQNNGEDEIYIVEIVKIVRRHKPRPLFDLIDTK